MTQAPIYKRAVSLCYDARGEGLPFVSAMGEELVADHIVKLARRYGIPIVEQPALAQALAQIPPNSSIPESLFEAVALVLWELDRQLTDA